MSFVALVSSIVFASVETVKDDLQKNGKLNVRNPIEIYFYEWLMFLWFYFSQIN